MNKSVLIVDDDRSTRRIIAGIVRQSLKMNFQEAENGKDALRILENNQSDIFLVVLDMDMPVLNGMETLQAIKNRYKNLPVIILTGNHETGLAVEAMKHGADDFLCKPVEGARLDVSIRNILKMSMMSREISRLKRSDERRMHFRDLIGFEGGLSKSVATGSKAAACDLPVMITGETGTGKEMFAQAIHGESQRSGNPFIAVNCGAIPEKLVESTLFGHEKGAFTGATNKSLGKFQEANGGTIFLDEIGELPLEAQVKLLRALQQGEVEPVGSAKPVSVDVRVISATNRNLVQDVKDGFFREDLFFRLNVLHIELPPLRSRKEDIGLLASCFMERFSASHHSPVISINDAALAKLEHYHWPGNVRELENTINRAMALCDTDALNPDDLSFTTFHDSMPTSYYDHAKLINPFYKDGEFKTFQDLELEIVAMALAHYEGNVTKTAKVLGLAKSTLYSKIQSVDNLKTA